MAINFILDKEIKLSPGMIPIKTKSLRKVRCLWKF